MIASFPPPASGELTEAAHSRAGSPERAVPKEGERGSPPRPGNSGGTPLKEELAEDPVPEEEIEPVPEEAVDPVPEQEAESVPEEEVDPVPEQEVEPVPEEGEDPTPRASRSSQLQPAASKTTSRQESQVRMYMCVYYSGTPLLWTPWGPSEVSCIERCPQFRG